ncbi:unnamed protein product [Allacma fusca]|uniref:Uncharacterized protein n=1 Tax=Allacma fusca TaxID=39272 RepID=A0A8J2PM85_9HEXA|nr:unnamed protein product [Allacma fusca]
MPSVSSLLENHHPSLSPIPGSPAHLVSNGNVNNSNNGNNNNNLPVMNNGGITGKSVTPNFDNLVLLARNLQSNSGSLTQLTGQNYPSHQLRYAAIANRLANRPNGNNCTPTASSNIYQFATINHTNNINVNNSPSHQFGYHNNNAPLNCILSPFKNSLPMVASSNLNNSYNGELLNNNNVCRVVGNASSSGVELLKSVSKHVSKSC